MRRFVGQNGRRSVQTWRWVTQPLVLLLGAMACRADHFRSSDEWWLTVLDRPHERGEHRRCVAEDARDNQPARVGHPSYCLVYFKDGLAVYRRDAAGTFVHGWRTWHMSPGSDGRWRVLRDSLRAALARYAATPAPCAADVPFGAFRQTIWRGPPGYALLIQDYEPRAGGPLGYQVDIAIGRDLPWCTNGQRGRLPN
jgi:hypothetical protein